MIIPIVFFVQPYTLYIKKRRKVTQIIGFAKIN